VARERREQAVTRPDGVLLDTSAWIAFFSPTGHSLLKSEVRGALQEERVHTCPVVTCELLIGVRDRKAFAKLADLLAALPAAPIDRETWGRAADLGFSLRRKGHSIPLPDLLIVEACRDASLTLWHLDLHLEIAARHTRIQARSFLKSA